MPRNAEQSKLSQNKEKKIEKHRKPLVAVKKHIGTLVQ